MWKPSSNICNLCCQGRISSQRHKYVLPVTDCQWWQQSPTWGWGKCPPALAGNTVNVREWETVKIIDKRIAQRGTPFICTHGDFSSEFYILHTLDLAVVVALHLAVHTANISCLVLHRLPWKWSTSALKKSETSSNFFLAHFIWETLNSWQLVGPRLQQKQVSRTLAAW